MERKVKRQKSATPVPVSLAAEDTGRWLRLRTACQVRKSRCELLAEDGAYLFSLSIIRSDH